MRGFWLAQTDGSSGDSGSSGADGGASSEVDDAINVVVDNWSVEQVDWADVGVAVAVLAVAVGLAYLVRRLIRRSTRRLEGTAAAAVAMTGQLVSIGVYLFATAIVLEILGFTLGPVLIIGLLVIVLFLVLRPVIQNLTSGLVLQMRGHCQPGDLVEIDGELGTVDEVNTRAVVLVAPDGRTVVLPNDQVIAGKLINYSRLGRRRSHITVRLPPDMDIAAFTDAVLAVIDDLSAVLDEPVPQVLLSGFDGEQPWADIYFWFEPDIETELTARDAVGRAVAALVAGSALELSDSSMVVRTISR